MACVSEPVQRDCGKSVDGYVETGFQKQRRIVRA